MEDKGGPRGAQGGPKGDRGGPRGTQGGPRGGPRKVKRGPVGAQGSQGGSWGALGAPQGSHWGAQRATMTIGKTWESSIGGPGVPLILVAGDIARQWGVGPASIILYYITLYNILLDYIILFP